jgi:hypothetical protein
VKIPDDAMTKDIEIDSKPVVVIPHTRYYHKIATIIDEVPAETYLPALRNLGRRIIRAEKRKTLELGKGHSRPLLASPSSLKVCEMLFITALAK